MSEPSQGKFARMEQQLRDIPALRENSAWRELILPAIEAKRDGHREQMRSIAKSAAERCEHLTAWEDAQALLEVLDAAERRLKNALAEHYRTAGMLHRPFADKPL